MLRVDLRAVRAGVRKCKKLGQQMRDLQSGKAIERANKRLQSDAPPERRL